MASILIVHYATDTGKYLVQKVGTSGIADGAITSALIGAGIIDAAHIANLGITSAKLAAALIASIEAGVADGGITSAKIASGAVGDAHIYPASIISSKIAANIIATPHIVNQGILSASFGANIIAAPHIANQGLLSANYGALGIGGAHVANQGLVSANLAAGVIGHTLVTDYGIVSGKIASGAITEGGLASGISIDIAEVGQEPTFRAQDLVSAYLGVYFSASGYFNYAQAATVTTMPAVGITIANITSGQIGTIHHTGRIRNTAWNFSGYVGSLGFLGTSSEVTLMVSGLMISGRNVQRMGEVIDEDAVFLRPELSFASIAE